MDANGTRYHLLLGEDDWLRCTEGGQQIKPVPDASLLSREALVRASGAGQAGGLAWSRERAEVTLRPRLFQFVAAPKDVPPPLQKRRGAARDRYGNWYWIDETERQIRANSEGTRRASNFWPPDPSGAACEPATDDGGGLFRPREVTPAPALQFRGLTVTAHHYLVVGVLEPAGLLFFDLHAGGAPQQILWPKEVPFVPFDMSPRTDGGLLVLDRDNRRFWTLDRRFNVVAEGQSSVTLKEELRDDFQPQGGGPERRTAGRVFPEGVLLEASSPVAAVDPVGIEAVPDGTALVLDRNPGEAFCRVFRYRFNELLGPPASTEAMRDLIEAGSEADFTLSGYDIAFLPEPEGGKKGRLGRVIIVGESGNQAFAFTASEKNGRLELEPLPDYLPMRLFGGKALARSGAQVFYDYGDGWIPLVEQRRPRYALEATLLTPLGETEATAFDAGDELQPAAARAFDGREPDCVWHRLMIDACIPPETEVNVWSRAADDERELALTEWRPEPRLYRRGSGSELPFLRDAGGAYATWELLFQKARGRFLQLKLELKGNGRTTPRVRALRAYYPRFSYLENYLPAVYREDAPSASFLDRFLANLEGFYTSIEDRIAAVQKLFDVRSAPPEALEWLAEWFGVALDPTWDDARRRLFIKHAMLFFQARGTIRGLQMALRLALDDCPGDEIFSGRTNGRARAAGIRIVEKFLTRRTPGVLLGDPTDLRGPSLMEQTARWFPAQGGAALHERYRDALSDALGGQQPGPFPLLAPGAPRAAVWRQFAQDVLGFVPATAAREWRLWQNFLKRRYEGVEKLNEAYGTNYEELSDVPVGRDAAPGSAQFRDRREYALEFAPASVLPERRWWQDFLARRYRSVAALNSAHATRWPSFEFVVLPDALPPDGRPLVDWYQFEAVVLPMRQTAHRFTVLLPLPAAATFDTAAQQRRLELARRIVNLEKPAHTVFDIKLYWAMFRVGEARLGDDTLLDVGSRAPQLMPPMVLGQGHLAESYIAPTHPQDVPDRQTLGFERLGG